ncbi:hypothetical protein Ahia01_000235100, partial [Argonauta hians]
SAPRPPQPPPSPSSSSLTAASTPPPPPPPPLDYLLVHDAGCTCDDTDLPHHRSTVQQIEQLLQCTDTLLSHLPRPAVVTIARSVSDEYCPPDQVDSIQQSVIQLLATRYGQLQQTQDYMTEGEEG